MRCLALIIVLLVIATQAMSDTRSEVEKAINSKTDYWGDLAMKEPNGPSYDFFAKLIPPLRYVDAGFKHYPIVLSAPNNKVKARYISNGSAVNALARTINWRSEAGNPVTFYVGRHEEVFGTDLSRLDGPRYENGYLPVVLNKYTHENTAYTQEAFASVDASYADCGTVFMRFTGNGKLVAQLAMTVTSALPAKDGVIPNSEDGALLWFGDGWTWEPGHQRLYSELRPGQSAYLVIFTQPLKSRLPKLDAALYDSQKSKCVDVWEAHLAKGMNVETPEPVVNDAWKSLIIGTLELVSGDDINYSAGNQYAKMYVGEGGDSIRAMALWGFRDDARRMLVPMMDYKREGLLFHQAGKKLQLLSHYYWLTRDESWFKEQRDRWTIQSERLVNGREKDSGLVPRERYCGDIETPVYSLNSNANGWNGLAEFSGVLDDMGEHAEAQRLAKSADEWLPHVRAAVEKSVRKDVNPPFVPIALFGEEQPYDPLTGSRLGGYWDLMAPYLLGSGLFRHNAQETQWIIDYLRQKGGLCMGLIRSKPQSSFWVVQQNVNDLYTLRYVTMLLQRDEVDRALVSFYGKLAQGLTRDTFIGGEGSCVTPLDEFGRQMYLPPNSAGNAFFLWMLRYLMVQDWDMDGDARPETLRLMFATPRRWMEDGKTIKVERAPTAFGEVSVSMTSHLAKGEIIAEVTAPPRPPEKTLIRARVPAGWKVTSAKVGTRTLPVDSRGTVDISGMKGRFMVQFQTGK